MSRSTRLSIYAALATVLTSVALHPLFVSGDWFVMTAFGVAIVAASGLLGRRFSLPAPACSLLALAALLWYLTVVFASSEATFRVIPDRSAIEHLIGLAGVGFEDISQYTAPVPSLAGINLVTVAGIGLMAIVVDMFAVGMRHAALAGLPLLAVFSVPVAIQLDSVGGIPFVIGATGYIGLLLADGRERLNRWGRPILVQRRSAASRAASPSAALPDHRPLSAAGRRIGFSAVLIALLFPLFVPELPTRAFFGTGGLGGVGGTNTIAAPSPMVSLKRDLTLPREAEVLRYRTQDQTPKYLRIYALERFDGERWRISRVRAGPDDRVTGQQLSVPGLDRVPTERVTTEISIDPNLEELKFLPLPYPPTRIEINGDWRVDRDTLMVFSTRDVASGRTYRVTSVDVNATRERLRSAPPPPADVRERYLQLPENVPERVRDLAREVTEDAATSYGKAVALQEWFTSGAFTYSTAAAGSSTSALTDFLLRSKTGYCEQFAASMALLARVVEIPARVAVGYTAGTFDGSEWSVTTSDAHAWPELYFDGVGWVRFEPTPAGAGGQSTASVPAYTQELVVEGPATGSTTPDNSAGAAGNTAPGPTSTADPGNRIDGRAPSLGGGGVGAVEAGSPWLTAASAAGIVVAVLLFTPMAVRWVTRRRRWATARNDGTRARAAWAELRDDAVDLAVPWQASDSPRAAARRVAERIGLGGSSVDALARIASAEERARYAPGTPDTDGLPADVRTVRRAMMDATSGGARWRARLFPASTIAAFSRTGRQFGSVLDRVDALRARARARLLPRWLGGG